MKAWDELGIIVKPHFATPYPGSVWFTLYRTSIEAQYNGDLEAFIMDLGDASSISVTICQNFNAVELIRLRELMLTGNIRLIDFYEKQWLEFRQQPDVFCTGPSNAWHVFEHIKTLLSFYKSI